LAPRGLLEFKLSATPALSARDLKVVLCCKSSGRAALAMQDMGYLNVPSIAGGFDAWAAAGLPVWRKKVQRLTARKSADWHGLPAPICRSSICLASR
jgi:hypothetical protein